jgi:uncharacterized protein (TIGR02452 family)
MSTFTSQMPRDLAARYGHEAVAIGERGGYTAPSGRQVGIRAAVEKAICGTVSYPPDHAFKLSAQGTYDTRFEVVNETTLSAARRQLDLGFRTVALNFASATSPGGGFLTGARAQEEYLARSSCLFQCIRDNPMYGFHRSNYDPIYTDYAIYSPDVPVVRDDGGALLETPYTVSILTCAAPNAKRVPSSQQHAILPAMWTRILKVLAIGLKHGHDAIVLGAWGCGAFGNDSAEIAALFHKALTGDFRGAYRHVVFAVVDWSPEKRFIGPFQKAFAGEVVAG